MTGPPLVPRRSSILLAAVALIAACNGAVTTGTIPLPDAATQGFFIRNVILPGTPSNGGCTYTSDISQAGESSGVVDLFFGLTTYTPEFLLGSESSSLITVSGATTTVTDTQGNVGLGTLLENDCTASGNTMSAACDTEKAYLCTQNPQTDPQCAAISAATPLPSVADPFSTLETQAIEPLDATTSAYAAMPITVLDAGTLKTLATLFNAEAAAMGPGLAGITALVHQQSSVELVTSTVARGTSVGGEPERSNTYVFPVTVCYGCLVDNFGVSEDGNLCVQATTGASSACVPGQDQPSAAPAEVNGVAIPACG